ncbi:Crp/Fnr family transcriptional regulator [uncultured Algibacter sp.]|uniref:Crp/Fnr family transcriptional regulator n=1 Tax=uncultured Algibacter sp. TaxID=298659 RepID=UPI0026113EDD|nr:Crp/Fnr family transcriptional regulator [uncultured Algibacter sp.]
MSLGNSINNKIFENISFSKEEIGIIESVFFKETYKKGTYLLKAGDIVNNQYYISEGCLRSYHTDAQGREYTVQFGIKDWWMSDFTAFFSNSQAILNIEVLQDTTLYRITREHKEYLYNQIPKVESFFRKKLERAFSAFQKRILSELSLTATERYVNFVKSYPNIQKYIKNYHIASYLGITTESLSRIRKELSHN